MKIALIGPRGAGKSKISRKLSKKTEKLLLSTDQLVCYEASGRTVKEIVEQEGWESFRNREYELLKKLHKMDNIIIDCGGGILFDIDLITKEEIESQRKIQLLKNNTFVIYVLRDLKNSQRPDLNSQKNYVDILKKRLPIYEKHANYILDMRNKEIEEAIEELIKLPQINFY